MKSAASRPSEGEYTFFELRLLCYFAPLKHCAEAIELSEELCKVLAQFLPVEDDRVCADSGQSLRVCS